MSAAQTIRIMLMSRFKNAEIEISNESSHHAVVPGTESHFRVVIVSEEFNGIPLLERHRLIYEALSVPLKNGVHALALHTYTPGEWRRRNDNSPTSPACRGGSKK